MYHQDEIAPAIIQTDRICHFERRCEIIGEILDYGRVAVKDEQLFQRQIIEWNLRLLKIPTDQLLACFIKASRYRVLNYDQENLTVDELLENFHGI